MGFSQIPAGKDVPNDVNVIIEIPANGAPIKYEIDKDTDAIFVDRFVGTAMHYPCNYGYIPQTLAEDGDPVDVLVITPIPLQVGVVIRSRVLGMLKMSDESGEDQKLIAVPVSKMTAMYDHVKTTDDLPAHLLKQIQHFFEHYKDLEPGKWVKVEGWGNIDEAKAEIIAGVERHNKENA